MIVRKNMMILFAVNFNILLLYFNVPFGEANRLYNSIALVQTNPVALCWQERSIERPGIWADMYNVTLSVCPTLSKTSWTIRGFWANLINYREQCRDTKRLITNFNTHGFEMMMRRRAYPLIQEMSEKWRNYRTDYNFALWYHEYKKHGVCLQDLPETDTIERFFSKGMRLFDVYNVYNFLKKENIVPRDEPYRSQDILNAITKGTCGKSVAIRCLQHPRTRLQYLLYVFICFDDTFNLVDCPQYSNCTNSIIYPPAPEVPIENTDTEYTLVFQEPLVSCWYENSLRSPDEFWQNLKLMSQKYCRSLLDNRWAIRGLWVNRESGIGEANGLGCSDAKGITIVNKPHKQINDIPDLKKALIRKWPSLKHGVSDEQLWDEEYAKHGRCAQKHPDLNDVPKYFGKAAELADKYDVANIIKVIEDEYKVYKQSHKKDPTGHSSSENEIPDGSDDFTINGVLNKIENRLSRSRINIAGKCIVDPVSGMEYLLYVYVCLDNQLNVKSCSTNVFDNRKGTDCTLTKPMLFPKKQEYLRLAKDGNSTIFNILFGREGRRDEIGHDEGDTRDVL